MENKEPLCRIRDILRYINDFETEFDNKYGIKLNEGMLLCSLTKFGKVSSGQAAELLGLSSSNCSKVITSAEKKGLIKRLIGSDDKRQMFFSLTKKGKECIDRIHCEDDHMIELINKIREI